jgi:hypothetical protein
LFEKILSLKTFYPLHTKLFCKLFVCLVKIFGLQAL